MHPHVHPTPTAHHVFNNHNHFASHSDDRTQRQKRCLQERLSKSHHDENIYYSNHVHPSLKYPAYNKTSNSTCRTMYSEAGDTMQMLQHAIMRNI